MERKMRNTSHGYDINRCRLNMDAVILNKKSVLVSWWLYILSNIGSSIHEKVKQHWGWVEKKRCL